MWLPFKPCITFVPCLSSLVARFVTWVHPCPSTSPRTRSTARGASRPVSPSCACGARRTGRRGRRGRSRAGPRGTRPRVGSDERSVADRFDRAAWPPPGSRTRLPTRSLIQSPAGCSPVDTHSLAVPLLSRFAARAGFVTQRQRFVRCCHGGWQRSSRRRFNRRLLIGLRTSGAENLSSRCRLEPVPYGLNRNACDHVRAS